MLCSPIIKRNKEMKATLNIFSQKSLFKRDISKNKNNKKNSNI